MRWTRFIRGKQWAESRPPDQQRAPTRPTPDRLTEDPIVNTKRAVEDGVERRPTHPGAILREDLLPALGLSISEAARQLGVTRQTLHRIMAEKVSITPEMAAHLGRVCGNGPGL